MLRASNEKHFLEAKKELDRMLENARDIPGIDRLYYQDSLDERTIRIRDQSEQLHQFEKEYKRRRSTSSSAKIRRILGRSSFPEDARTYRRIAEDNLDYITMTSHLRRNHVRFSRMAFDQDLSFINTLTTAQTSKAQWTFTLYHTTIPSVHTSIDSCHPNRAVMITGATDTLIMTSGVTYETLFKWWRKFHLDNDELRTSVWNDMRSMARKLIPLLDHIESNTNIEDQYHNSLLECIAQAEKIGSIIVTLLDTRVRHLERIRPYSELFATILFFLCDCLQAVKEKERLTSIRMPLATITPLKSAMHELRKCVECLQDHLKSEEEENDSVQGDGTSRDRLVFDAESKQSSESDRVSNECIRALKRLQIPEIKLESYAIDDLGRGSYATVKKYNSLDGSHQYAVKIFSRTDATYDSRRAQNHIGREARIWQQLKHKNINQLHGFCNFGETIFPGLVMDICEDNIDRYCNEKRPDLIQRLDFMFNVTSGLQYLHSHPERFVHGDLRPQNILIRHPETSVRPYAVLTDFGTADTTRFIANRTFVMTDGQQTPEPYRAPEFGSDSNDTEIKLSAPADMYAFGCVYAQIVCRQTLIHNPQYSLFILPKKKALPVSLDSITNIRDKLLLRKLWSEKPESRPTASEVSGVIDQCIVFADPSNCA